MKTNLIFTSSANHIAKALFKISDFEFYYTGRNKDGQKYFPDGEVYVKLGKIPKRRTVVVHAGGPQPNDGLVELELLLKLLKDRRTSSLELFLTYFPYCKQDLVFEEGEINVAENLIEKWTDIYGVKKIYIIDPHFKGRDWVKKYPVECISIMDHIKKTVLRKYPEIIFVAPDRGSARRNNLPAFDKKREGSYKVEVSCSRDLQDMIKGRVVGIIDDMIETGGTMINVYKKCKELKTKKVIALVTHGVLSAGVNRIKNTFDDLFLTNTIDCKHANVDVSKLIVRYLNKKIV